MRALALVAMAVALVGACTSFGASTPAPPPEVPDAGPDAAPSPEAGSAGCSGKPLGPLVVMDIDKTIGPPKSARRGPDGVFYVGFDKSPDDTIVVMSRQGNTLTMLPDARVDQVVLATVDELDPTVAADDLLFVFASNRADAGGYQLYASRRDSAGAAFPAAGALDLLAARDRRNPWLVDRTLYFTDTTGSARLKMGTVSQDSRLTGETDMPIAPGISDGFPVVSRDQLEVFFSRRLGAGGKRHVFHATRTDRASSFENIEDVTPAEMDAYPTWISDDGCEVFIIRDAGTAQLVSSTR